MFTASSDKSPFSLIWTSSFVDKACTALTIGFTDFNSLELAIT